MLNNNNLVDYAKKALAEGWGYVWGTFGEVLTEAELEQKLKQYPGPVGNYLGFIRSHWMNKIVTDCVGLIKGAYWSESGALVYNPVNDVSADGMLSIAKEKGPIATIPDIPGICVHLPGHIGIYIGGGMVIEAHGTEYGVIQTPLQGGTPWVNWSKCPFIQYATQTAPVVVAPAVVPAHTNNSVAGKLQIALNLGGFTDYEGHQLLVDGDPGPRTRSAMAKVALGPGSINAIVGFVQEEMNEKMGWHIGVDNHYGNPFVAPHYHETYDALGTYQAAKGLIHDFVIGQQTLGSFL